MATDPASAPAPAAASAPAPAPAPEPHPGSGRRTLLRALTGGGAFAALTLTAAPDAQAAGHGAARRAAGRGTATHAAHSAHLTNTAASAGTSGAAAAAGPHGAHSADPFAPDGFRPTGRIREFWVQADSFTHNATPGGYDGMSGMRLAAADTTFPAIGLRAYSPGWGRPLPGDDGPQGIGPNSGIPGPVLRAQVGDLIRVHFRNNDAHYRWPHSLHPHGVRYTPANDGGWTAAHPERAGTAVPYGGSYTYTWQCTPGSVGTWPYHDHAAPQTPPQTRAGSAGGSGGGPAGGAGAGGAAGGGAAAAGGPGGMVMEIGAELGMFGMIAVADERTAPVDREFVLFFHELTGQVVPTLRGELGMCNGGAYLDGSPQFTARVGDRVRWRIGALGNSFHVFHIHGHRWRSADGWTDAQVLGPATTLTVEYTEDNPGEWLYHCHLPGHMMHGMVGRYVVTS